MVHWLHCFWAKAGHPGKYHYGAGCSHCGLESKNQGQGQSHVHSNVLQLVLYFTVLAVSIIYSKFELISEFNSFFLISGIHGGIKPLMKSESL